MGVVHFTIGENFGILLANLAYENIICEYDIKKAFKVINV